MEPASDRRAESYAAGTDGLDVARGPWHHHAGACLRVRDVRLVRVLEAARVFVNGFRVS
jgi:hypothetical protein